mmetsp:Transcript_48393/g.96848  ORF Transcript_48393/g.96848 Transcript_48393/m.96848 type:complete len:101 (-) Transcript_48393:70-372(-)
MRKKKINFYINENEIIFYFYGENHTLGNVLRFFIQGNPIVDLVGYNIPHPLENVMHLKLSSKFVWEQVNIVVLAIKNCGEVGILVGNLFNKEEENKKRFI